MKISRRSFTALSLAGLGFPGTILADRLRKGKPVAIVLEHTESYTRNTTGATVMLRRAGFEVIPLVPQMVDQDLSPSKMVLNFGDASGSGEIQKRLETPRHTFSAAPDPEKVDLIFFGTFANHGQPYHDYLRQYASRIPSFVEAGGVVVEMNQWARYAFLHPRFLPKGMEIGRETWSDSDQVMITVDDHPLVTSWAGGKGQFLQYPTQPRRPGRAFEGRRSWQSIVQWEGMQVLMAAGGGYKGDGGRASLVEGAHGKGRYIFTSLWLDKLFNEDGDPVAHPETMQAASGFFGSLREYVLAIRNRQVPPVKPTPPAPEPWIGPSLGHVDHQQAIVWARANRSGEFELHLSREGDSPKHVNRITARADAANDYCLHWRIQDLEPDTIYSYTIRAGAHAIFQDTKFPLKTAPHPDVRSRATLVFGSCADQNGRFEELWKQIERVGADGMVLLGDTPYIDSTMAQHQQVKHREFLTHKGPAYLSRRIPFWGTWDDHDFGANASDGRLHNRVSARQVFKQYRALTHYGENEEGIYTSFRRGPMEVFILDIRYFGSTQPSFADPAQPTLIGNQQWEWLKRKLLESDAPFKILTCGMSWSAKADGPQTDSWGRHAYEREAIIDFIGAHRISGVILVGGDIHCTQVMKLPSEERIGYPLYHIVTSPMHNRVNPDHEKDDFPGMLFTRAEPNSFVRIVADTTVQPCLLEVDVMNIAGQSIFRLVTGDDLNVTLPPAKSPEKTK